MGSAPIFEVGAWLGYKVIENAAADVVKPLLVEVARLIVLGQATPDVKVTGCVADVSTTTSANATLVAFMLSARIAELSRRVKLANMLPALAVVATA